MSIPEAEARVKARVWQAVAQSEIDLSALPKETVVELVDVLAEVALIEIDTYLGESLDTDWKLAPVTDEEEAKPEGDAFDPDPLKEDVLWEGRPFMSLTTRYVVTDERIRIFEGIFSRKREDIELIRIQDLGQNQAAGERVLNLGDIVIRSHDPNKPVMILRNVSDPEKVHEILRRAILNARQRHNFSYQEEM